MESKTIAGKVDELFNNLSNGYKALAEEVYESLGLATFFQAYGIDLITTRNDWELVVEGVREPVAAWQHSRFSYEGDYCIPDGISDELSAHLESWLMDYLVIETPGVFSQYLGTFIAEYHNSLNQR